MNQVQIHRLLQMVVKQVLLLIQLLQVLVNHQQYLKMKIAMLLQVKIQLPLQRQLTMLLQVIILQMAQMQLKLKEPTLQHNQQNH